MGATPFSRMYAAVCRQGLMCTSAYIRLRSWPLVWAMQCFRCLSRPFCAFNMLQHTMLLQIQRMARSHVAVWHLSLFTLSARTASSICIVCQSGRLLGMPSRLGYFSGVVWIFPMTTTVRAPCSHCESTSATSWTCPPSNSTAPRAFWISSCGSTPLAANTYPPTRTNGKHSSASTRVSATARATAASYASRCSSSLPKLSARACTACMLFNCNLCADSCTKAILLACASIMVNFHSGFATASTNPGSPGPHPTSTRRA
mmetsp:Transcript_10520/g.64463  ORF Transcript_10520/g.64463 Transcript_10520/m.64463 type:complete len:259 (-) Transcript_10520:16613-17389(-)